MNLKIQACNSQRAAVRAPEPRSMNPIRASYKVAKRLAVAIIGASVLVVGIVMIVTPGPALVLIPAGLAILGLEFAWARVWLKRLRENLSSRNQRTQAERAEQHRRRHPG